MAWIAATVIMVFVMGGLLWLLSLGSDQGGLHPGQRNASPGPETFTRRPPEDPHRASGRLELPPGPEGHLMAAQAIERAASMYRRVCEERVR